MKPKDPNKKYLEIDCFKLNCLLFEKKLYPRNFERKSIDRFNKHYLFSHPCDMTFKTNKLDYSFGLMMMNFIVKREDHKIKECKYSSMEMDKWINDCYDRIGKKHVIYIHHFVECVKYNS